MSSPIRTDYTKKNQSDDKVSVKKSTFHTLLAGFVVAIAIATFLGGYAVGTFDDDSDSTITAEQLQEIISNRESKPQEVIPSQVPAQQSLSSGSGSALLSIDDDPVKGDPNAPVTVIEFSDFQCPFCARFSTQTLPVLEQYYVDTGEIKIVYKDLPLQIHPNARSAHIAAECADEQGKFWEYHDILFSKQSQWQNYSVSNLDPILVNFATDLGMDENSFQECLKSVEISVEVDEDVFQAANNDAQGTPTFFIGNEKNGFTKVVGAQPYYVFAEIIDDKLE